MKRNLFWFVWGAGVSALICSFFWFWVLQKQKKTFDKATHGWVFAAGEGIELEKTLQDSAKQAEEVENVDLLASYMNALAIHAAHFYQDGKISAAATGINQDFALISHMDLLSEELKSRPDLIANPMGISMGSWGINPEIKALFSSNPLPEQIKDQEEYERFVEVFYHWLQEYGFELPSAHNAIAFSENESEGTACRKACHATFAAARLLLVDNSDDSFARKEQVRRRILALLEEHGDDSFSEEYNSQSLNTQLAVSFILASEDLSLWPKTKSAIDQAPKI